jgi:lysozyme
MRCQVLTRPVALMAVLVVLAGCGGSPSAGPASMPTDSPSASPAPSVSASATPTLTPAPTATPKPGPTLGVDVSHHKGVVDWRRVRADGISFAYLKATEGTGFTDPRFADNLRDAKAAGLRAGGYHYFTLCGAGAPQAGHYLSAIGGDTTMPPAVDVEFIGNCEPGPPREELLRELRAFIDAVETRTGKRVVVYLHPDVEERHRIADDLDRRQWVRSLGSRPQREWWIWQKSDSAAIDGIDSPADLNQMR